MDSNPETRRSLIILLAGTVAFVALLTWWVGWALPLVIFAIIFIVMATSSVTSSRPSARG